MGFYEKIPTGIAVMAWPKRRKAVGGSRSSKKHCPKCAACNRYWCYKESPKDHVVCVRHADTRPASGR